MGAEMRVADEQTRFTQQLSGNWNEQILSNEDKLSPLSKIMERLAILEEEKNAANLRLEEEFRLRGELEEKFYKQKRNILVWVQTQHHHQQNQQLLKRKYQHKYSQLLKRKHHHQNSQPRKIRLKNNLCDLFHLWENVQERSPRRVSDLPYIYAEFKCLNITRTTYCSV